MSRPHASIGKLLPGGYVDRLTKREPRKKIKPINSQFTEYTRENMTAAHLYRKRIIPEFKESFKLKFKFNIFKTKGEKLHVFLPLTGGSPTGYGLKAFFEQILPKARITFLVTPSSSELLKRHSMDFEKKALHNLENHIKKSLNKNDEYFVVFDLLCSGTTSNNIQNTLTKIYNKPQNYLFIESVDNLGAITLIKDEEGRNIKPLFKKAELKRVIAKHYNDGFELAKDKKFIEELKN